MGAMRRWLRHLVPAVAVALMVAACATPPNAPAVAYLTGTVYFRVEGLGADCVGPRGWTDIHPGTTVTVSGGGRSSSGPLVVLDRLPGECRFEFVIPVAEADIYGIRIGPRTPRGYDAVPIRAAGWQVTLSLA